MNSQENRAAPQLLFLILFLAVLFSASSAFAAHGNLTKDGEGYYLISDAEDFKAFNDAKYFDANACLTRSFELSITSDLSIGTYDNSYTGTFDGKNNTITLKGSKPSFSGLFGYIGSNGVVKNLKVKADGVTFSANWSGVIAGVNFGIIDNCVSVGDIQLNGDKTFGGIVGRNYGHVTGCTNSADITITSPKRSWIGGIAGRNEIGAAITDCTNNGYIINNIKDTPVGGVVGSNSGSISESHNYGNIKKQ